MLAFVTIFSSAFAGGVGGVNEKTLETFKKEFASAKKVSWETTKDYTKATFEMNNQVMFAYYSVEGEFIAVSRNLLSSQLPITLATELKKTYNGFWITDLFEYAAPNSTSYFITIENADQVYVLKSNGVHGWEVFKKGKKNQA